MANKINLPYLAAWMGIVSVGMFQFGYGIGMFNNFTSVLFYQYKAEGKAFFSNIDDFNAAVTTVVPLGAAFGAFTGGLLCSLGRRNAIFIANMFIIIGAGITMIFNLWALLGGRLILGYACGAYTVISPLFISETSPEEVAGSMGALNQFMVTAGIMVAYFFGFGVPFEFLKGVDPEIEGNRNQEVYDTHFWRVVFIIPAGIAILQSLFVLFIFRYDTPKYYSQKGDDESAQKVEDLIYKEHTTDINVSQNTPEKKEKEEKVPISALLTSKYRGAFIIGCALALCQQLTGINAVIFYSNDIFVGDKKGFESERAARIGTVLVGIVNWASAMMSIPLLLKFGRKSLLIFGQITMGISLAVLGIFAIIENSTGIIVFTFLFVAFFEFSIGPILWLYAAEVMTESGMAAASLITWIITIIFGLFTKRLFALLTPKGMYFSFTVIDIIGLIFIVFFIKETMGKTKLELRSLYSKEDYQQLENNKEEYLKA